MGEARLVTVPLLRDYATIHIDEWTGAGMPPICGPMFTLDDGTGELLVMYVRRCESAEVSAVTGLAGGPVRVVRPLDAETVIRTTDNTEYPIRVVATSIRRGDQGQRHNYHDSTLKP